MPEITAKFTIWCEACNAPLEVSIMHPDVGEEIYVIPCPECKNAEYEHGYDDGAFAEMKTIEGNKRG